jgi:predicted acetyltransferase
MIVVETPRLLLRHLILDDLPAVTTLFYENIASQRVALKNGMVYERDFVDKRGKTRRIYATHLAGHKK